MALTDNLVSHWALDESSDGSVAVTRNDSHGTNHLTDTNTVPSATGLVGQAASIDRNNGEYLSRVGIGSDLQVGNFDWAVVVWLYPTGTGNDTFLQWNGPSGSDIQMRKNAASTVRVLATDAGGTSTQHNTSAALTLNAWNCVIVSYLATTDQIRVRINDGTAQLFSKASIRQQSTEFQIGSTWLGLIDLVSFYQGRALSEAEESELWNGGDGLSYGDFGGGGSFGDMVGAASLDVAASGAIGGVGSLSGDTDLSIDAGGTLSGVADAAGAVSIDVPASGTISGFGSLQGDASLEIAASGTITATASLAGTITLDIVVAGGISILGNLSGEAVLTVTASGDLQDAVPTVDYRPPFRVALAPSATQAVLAKSRTTVTLSPSAASILIT